MRHKGSVRNTRGLTARNNVDVIESDIDLRLLGQLRHDVFTLVGK